MMFIAGVPLRFLGKFLGASAVLVVFVTINALYFPADWRISLQEYQRQRLLVYFHKDFAPPNATPAERKAARALQRERTHNIRQAEISVGSGGLTGKGWGQGPQTRLGYLPRGVAHNDFIFSVIAEETGFLGSMVVLALYPIILLKGMETATQARERLGKLLAVGIVTLIFLPRLCEYRHALEADTSDGNTVAIVELWRVVRIKLADRHRRSAKHTTTQKYILSYHGRKKSIWPREKTRHVIQAFGRKKP